MELEASYLFRGVFRLQEMKLPHPVDVYIGTRVMNERVIAGMTQGELAQRIGVRFQQVQKYETGANRISGSKLWEISRALNVAVEQFFPPSEELKPVPPSNLDSSDAKLVGRIKRLGVRDREAVTALVNALGGEVEQAP